MLINTKVFLPATSGATSFNSTGYPLGHVVLFYIQAVITGTLAGTAKLQTSGEPILTGDPNAQPASTSWVDYTGSSQTIASAGVAAWNVADVGFNWVRIVYTASSGTGTITGTIDTTGF